MCGFGWLRNMAERTGLEPATPGVTGRYSNQLNYRSEFWGANANGLINKATSSFASQRPGPVPRTCPLTSTDRLFERCALHAARHGTHGSASRTYDRMTGHPVRQAQCRDAYGGGSNEIHRDFDRLDRRHRHPV